MQEVYNFSDEAVIDYKKRNRVMMFMLPLIVVIFSSIMFRLKGLEDIKFFSMIVIGVSAFIMLEVYIVSRVMVKKIKNTRLDISENHFVRIAGAKSERVSFEDIKSVKEKRDPKGKLLMIELKTSKKPINIFGFDNLEDILRIILERSDSDINYKVKKYKLDWNNPLVIALIMLLTVVFIGGLLNFDEGIYKIFNSLFMICFGIFFIFYKPLSKSLGLRFRLFEIICGGFIITPSLISILELIF